MELMLACLQNLGCIHSPHPHVQLASLSNSFHLHIRPLEIIHPEGSPFSLSSGSSYKKCLWELWARRVAPWAMKQVQTR